MVSVFVAFWGFCGQLASSTKRFLAYIWDSLNFYSEVGWNGEDCRKSNFVVSVVFMLSSFVGTGLVVVVMFLCYRGGGENNLSCFICFIVSSVLLLCSPFICLRGVFGILIYAPEFWNAVKPFQIVGYGPMFICTTLNHDGSGSESVSGRIPHWYVGFSTRESAQEYINKRPWLKSLVWHGNTAHVFDCHAS